MKLKTLLEITLNMVKKATQCANKKSKKQEIPIQKSEQSLSYEINGKAYSILMSRVEAFTPIRLDNGEYEGVVYHYGKVKFVEENDKLRVVFDYFALENIDKITDRYLFSEYIGDILGDIMEHSLENGVNTIPFMSKNELGYIGNS